MSDRPEDGAPGPGEDTPGNGGPGRSPARGKKGPTVGLGGCLTGFVVGGLVLGLGYLLLGVLPLHGVARTLAEIGLMGLALGACLFIWKVAATADEMARQAEIDDGDGSAD
jgi:hypothetical protein